MLLESQRLRSRSPVRLRGASAWAITITMLLRSHLLEYLIACSLAATGLGARYILQPVLGSTVPYITFFPAVAVSAWHGGLGPGLCTTLVSAAAALYFIIPPEDSFTIWSLSDGLGLVLFLGVGSLISCLTHALRQERENVKRNVERLALAQAAAEFGVWDWNAQSGGLEFTRKLYDLAGMKPTAMKPSFDRWLACIHPDDRPQVRTATQQILAGKETINTEFRVLQPSGDVRWLLARAKVFRDSAGGLNRVIGVTIDITDRKQGEEALQNLNDELQHTNSELEQYAFAANHDLQEPLRNISLYSQLLDKEYGRVFDERAQEYFGYIQEGTRRMQCLIQALLSYSRVIAEKERSFVGIDLNAVLSKAKEDCKTLLGESGSVIGCDELPTIRGEFEPLVAVFNNLITNAIKYRTPGQPANIHIWAERTGAQWRIAVEDNGIGISSNYHEQIFRFFKRLHGQSIPGAGVGLALCRKIIEQHGGRIWVKSAEGKGATFLFTLPAGNSDAEGVPLMSLTEKSQIMD